MANGDDFQSSSEGDGPSNPPVPTEQPDGGAGGDGISSLDEGWGDGAATVDEVFDNIKAVFRGVQGNILMAWLALAGVTFLIESFDAFVYLIGSFGILGDLTSLLLWPVQFLAGLLGIAITAAQLTLYGPLREKVFHGIEPDSWSEALESVRERGLMVLIAVVAIGVGVIVTCVIPGLVLAFFAVLAPYYLATSDIDFTDAFKKSYEMAKKYWQVVLLTIAGLFGAGMLLGCLTAVGFGVSGVLPSPVGYIFSTYASWFGSVLFQFFLFVVWGGVFVTVDANESGQIVRV